MPWLKQLVIGPSLHEPGLIPVQFMWCLWQTDWHWDRFFMYEFSFLCHCHSVKVPVSFICLTLILY